MMIFCASTERNIKLWASSQFAWLGNSQVIWKAEAKALEHRAVNLMHAKHKNLVNLQEEVVKSGSQATTEGGIYNNWVMWSFARVMHSEMKLSVVQFKAEMKLKLLHLSIPIVVCIGEQMLITNHY